MLFHHIHYEHCARQTGHVSDRTKVLLQLLALTGDLQFLALRDVIESAVGGHLVDGCHLLHSLANRGEVGQHTACPTLRDIRHVHLLCVSGNYVLCLFLRTYKQHLATGLSQVFQRLCCLVNLNSSLVQVNDVDTVALHIDIRSHSGIPFAFQVTKVATCFEKLIKIRSHFCKFLMFCFICFLSLLPRLPYIKGTATFHRIFSFSIPP